MTKKLFTIALLISLLSISCNQSKQQEAKSDEISLSKTENKTPPLIGSWVEPNPINEKEVQGFTLKNDGVAESINMATLIYKKWWKEADKLVLIRESIGNGSSSLDTIKYNIVKLNERELELKDKDVSIKYTKQ